MANKYINQSVIVEKPELITRGFSDSRACVSPVSERSDDLNINYISSYDTASALDPNPSTLSLSRGRTTLQGLTTIDGNHSVQLRSDGPAAKASGTGYGLSPPCNRREDGRSHLYEELPANSSGYENNLYEYSSAACGEELSPLVGSNSACQSLLLDDASMSTTLTLVNHNNNDSTQAYRTNNTRSDGYRRRVNPLYSSMCTVATPTTKAQSPFCFSTFLPLLSILLAAASCILASYCFVKLNPCRKGGECLEHYDVHTIPTSFIGNEHQALLNASFEILQLNSLVKDLKEQLDRLKSNVSSQLSHISKMPGPQGPAGVGNLSACRLVRKEGAGSVPSIISNPYPPNVEEAQDVVITGASCTTTGATLALLNVSNFNNSSFSQYTCMCSGHSGAVISERRCYMYLWVCPRTS